MAGMYYVSQSDKLKGYFANYGMDSYNSVKYATIGANTPETALDSVGTRFDKGDFFDDDGHDDFANEPPRLVSRDADRNRDRDRDRRREPVPRGVDTAAASVPKLSKPPAATGGGGADDDGEGLDLL